jgi:hypothetical protein
MTSNYRCARMASKRKAQVVKAGIVDRIVIVRGVRVILDAEIAELYGVNTGALNQAVRRNASRFPNDFAFRLTKQEVTNLKSQIVISSSGHGGRRRSPPLAFTEQGVAMLSSVLRSEQAIAVNIEIMRAFVELRRFLASNAHLARRLDEMERQYDEQFAVVFKAIRELMDAEAARRARRLHGGVRVKPPIGFRSKDG